MTEPALYTKAWVQERARRGIAALEASEVEVVREVLESLADFPEPDGAIDAAGAIELARDWAESRRSHINVFLNVEPQHPLGGPLDRPATLAAVAQADAAEVGKWSALAVALDRIERGA